MLTISDLAATALLRGNQRRYLRVESWYDDILLDDDVPVSIGQEEVDRSSNVPERVTLTVPRIARGVDYTPLGVMSPLAANGQLLRVTIGIGTSFGVIEWLQRGWYVITESQVRGDQIEVEAAGLLYKIQEARLVNPLQPSGTFVSTVRALVEPAITVEFDALLADRAVPASVNYDEDRLAALTSVLAAWPAECDMTAEGYLYVNSVVEPTVPVLALTSGTGGTVIRASGSSSRDGVYNAVVAQGTAADGGLLRGVAYDLKGPKRSGGPFNELPVPRYLESPLITTQAQANSAAASMLLTMKRSTSLTYDVDMVPHPALVAGDLVTLTDAVLGLDATPCVVEKLSLPLTAEGGAMRLTVRTT